MTDAPPPAPAAPAAANPGKTLGIVALVLSILPFQLVGIILGFVALSQSKKVGQKNGFAVAAIIVGFALMALAIIIWVVAFAGTFAFIGGACAELGSGVWEVNGVTYTCP